MLIQLCLSSPDASRSCSVRGHGVFGTEIEFQKSSGSDRVRTESSSCWSLFSTIGPGVDADDRCGDRTSHLASEAMSCVGFAVYWWSLVARPPLMVPEIHTDAVSESDDAGDASERRVSSFATSLQAPLQFSLTPTTGVDTETGEEIAIKLESVDATNPRLEYEISEYKSLAGGIGIPFMKLFGIECDYNALVLNKLGP